jgi:uncharacterized membrane protein YtjA (UPF0391 family)
MCIAVGRQQVVGRNAAATTAGESGMTSFLRGSYGSSASKGDRAMLGWALMFLVLALIAAFFGFAGVANVAVGIAQILFIVFLVIFAISLIAGLATRTRV